jgi:hypothetical protein
VKTSNLAKDFNVSVKHSKKKVLSGHFYAEVWSLQCEHFTALPKVQGVNDLSSSCSWCSYILLASQSRIGRPRNHYNDGTTLGSFLGLVTKPEKEGGTRSSRKIRNEELRSLYSIHNISRMFETRNDCLSENLSRRDYLGDIDVDGRIIFKTILKNRAWRCRMYSSDFRADFILWACLIMVMNFRGWIKLGNILTSLATISLLRTLHNGI